MKHKGYLLFLSLLCIGCGEEVSSSIENTSTSENISISETTSFNDTISQVENVIDIDLSNDYKAVHLSENETARNDIFSRFNDILNETSYQRVDLDNDALKILEDGIWNLNFNYEISKIVLNARVYTKSYKDYATNEDKINIDNSKLYVNNEDLHLEIKENVESTYKDYTLTFENVTKQIEISSSEGRTYIKSLKIFYLK